MSRKLRPGPLARAALKARALNSSPKSAAAASSSTVASSSPASSGSAEPQERGLKRQLAVEVNRILEQRALTQTEAAEKLGIAQPHVSELAHYRLERFSAERLMQFLAQLGQEVEIRIHGGSSRMQRPAVRRIFLR
jgi:predicted XRE-type DNA-binding protein